MSLTYRMGEFHVPANLFINPLRQRKAV